MKILKKITGAIAKIAELICIVAILALVVIIVAEVINRNIFNKSFRPTIELCGVVFLWMAFTGIIPLYNENGLMRLDFVAAKAKGVFAEIIYYVNKAASLLLGVVMVMAFFAQYPFFSTRTYASFPMKVPYTIQYIPMLLAGAFIALKTIEQVIEHSLELKKGGVKA